VRALQEQLDSAHSAPQPDQASPAEVAALRARVAELECAAASWRPAGSPGGTDAAAAASVASEEDDWAAGSFVAGCRASSAGGSSRGIVTPEGSGERRRPASMESASQETGPAAADVEETTMHAAEQAGAAVTDGAMAEGSLAMPLAEQPSADDASMATMQAEHTASQDEGMDDKGLQPAEALQESQALPSAGLTLLRLKAGLLAAGTEQVGMPRSISTSSDESPASVLLQHPWVRALDPWRLSHACMLPGTHKRSL
jgi:hypothetical protein